MKPPAERWIFRPVSKHLSKVFVLFSPWWATYLSLLLWCLAIVEDFRPLFAISFMFDCLDGDVARAQGRVTQIGRFMDPMLDRLKELLLCVYWLPHPFGAIVLVSIWGLELAGAYNPSKGKISSGHSIRLGAGELALALAFLPMDWLLAFLGIGLPLYTFSAICYAAVKISRT